MEDLSGTVFLGLSSSLADSLARISRSEASMPGLVVHDRAYGRSSVGWLARYDPSTRSWRTRQRSLLGTTGGGLEGYSGTWPRSGMTLSGTAYRLPPLVRLTGETGPGLLPTTSANDGKGFYVVGRSGAEMRILTQHGRHQIHWAQYGPILHDLSRGWANPSFSEMMMGYPKGWSTSRCCAASATPSCPRSPI